MKINKNMIIGGAVVGVIGIGTFFALRKNREYLIENDDILDDDFMECEDISIDDNDDDELPDELFSEITDEDFKKAEEYNKDNDWNNRETFGDEDLRKYIRTIMAEEFDNAAPVFVKESKKFVPVIREIVDSEFERLVADYDDEDEDDDEDDNDGMSFNGKSFSEMMKFIEDNTVDIDEDEEEDEDDDISFGEMMKSIEDEEKQEEDIKENVEKEANQKPEEKDIENNDEPIKVPNEIETKKIIEEIKGIVGENSGANIDNLDPIGATMMLYRLKGLPAPIFISDDDEDDDEDETDKIYSDAAKIIYEKVFTPIIDKIGGSYEESIRDAINQAIDDEKGENEEYFKASNDFIKSVRELNLNESKNKVKTKFLKYLNDYLKSVAER